MHSLQDMSVQPEQSKWLWLSSWLNAVSLCGALLVHADDLALLAALVLTTSLNYWRKPDYGWRRYMDIVVVQLALWWLSLRNLDTLEPYRTVAFLILLIMVGTFVTSMLYRNHVKFSTTLHMLVHLFGNVASLFVYSGGLPHTCEASVVLALGYIC